MNIFADSEYEFVGMGNRHIPTKCIALETCRDQPGTQCICKSVEGIANGFKEAFDVALSSNGDLGVTDVQAQKLIFLQHDLNGTYKVTLTVGTGTISCSDGPAANSQLSELTGLCFDFGKAISSCFGGSQNGYIKICSGLNFALIFYGQGKRKLPCNWVSPLKGTKPFGSAWKESHIPICGKRQRTH